MDPPPQARAPRGGGGDGDCKRNFVAVQRDRMKGLDFFCANYIANKDVIFPCCAISPTTRLARLCCSFCPRNSINSIVPANGRLVTIVVVCVFILILYRRELRGGFPLLLVSPSRRVVLFTVVGSWSLVLVSGSYEFYYTYIFFCLALPGCYYFSRYGALLSLKTGPTKSTIEKKTRKSLLMCYYVGKANNTYTTLGSGVSPQLCEKRCTRVLLK